MIKSITVTNFFGESLTMDLFNPGESGFIIKKIEGLGPGKARINTTDIASADGSLYNSARIDTRNIVLTLMPMAKPLVEDMRLLSYKYFPIKKELTLHVVTDNRSAWIKGYVESNEPDIFEKEETQTISIICTYPYFKAENEDAITSFSGVIPLFEFAWFDYSDPEFIFENNSLEENLIEFGRYETRQSATVAYNGDSEVGMLMKIHINGSVSGLKIFNVATNEVMTLLDDKFTAISGSAYKAGDTIIINTTPGEKSLMLLRNGKYTNILNCMDRGSQWFKLHPGDNILGFSAATNPENLTFEVGYHIVYEGV